MPETFVPNLWTMVTVVGAVSCLVPIVAILTEHKRKLRQAELDNELKRDLVAQGRGLDEIQAVLDLKPENRRW